MYDIQNRTMTPAEHPRVRVRVRVRVRGTNKEMKKYVEKKNNITINKKKN
jgi:hypothetical protein